jgi:hypothetical protein
MMRPKRSSRLNGRDGSKDHMEVAARVSNPRFELVLEDFLRASEHA